MARTPINIKLHKIKDDGFQKWVEFEGEVKFLCSPPTIKQKIFLRDLFLSEKDDTLRGVRVAEWFLRFTIKDWEGMGEDCLVMDGELSERQWMELIYYPEQTFAMVTEIQKHIDYSIAQKKN